MGTMIAVVIIVAIIVGAASFYAGRRTAPIQTVTQNFTVTTSVPTTVTVTTTERETVAITRTETIRTTETVTSPVTYTVTATYTATATVTTPVTYTTTVTATKTLNLAEVAEAIRRGIIDVGGKYGVRLGERYHNIHVDVLGLTCKTCHVSPDEASIADVLYNLYPASTGGMTGIDLIDSTACYSCHRAGGIASDLHMETGR